MRVGPHVHQGLVLDEGREIDISHLFRGGIVRGGVHIEHVVFGVFGSFELRDGEEKVVHLYFWVAVYFGHKKSILRLRTLGLVGFCVGLVGGEREKR